MQQSSDKMGLGFIGLGWWAGVLADAAIASGSANIIGGYARTAGTRAKFNEKYHCPEFTSLEQLLAEPTVQAVVIATNNSAHKEQAILAARAGKHIHLEKPMALNVTDAKEIIRVCQDQGVKLHIGQCYRRMPLFRRAKEIIDSQKLGALSLSTAHFSDKLGLTAGKDSMRWDPTENPGGPLYSYTIHMADLLEHFMGEVIAVNGMCSKVGGPSATHDNAAALLHFKTGQIGILSSSYVASNRLEMVIEGTHGTLLLSNKAPALIQPIEGYAGNPPLSAETLMVDVDYATGYTIAMKEQFSDLAHCIAHDKEPEVNGLAGLRALAIMRALLKSHHEQRLVTLEEMLTTD